MTTVVIGEKRVYLFLKRSVLRYLTTCKDIIIYLFMKCQKYLKVFLVYLQIYFSKKSIQFLSVHPKYF